MQRIEAESIIKDHEIFSTSLEDFVANLQINIISRTEDTLEFDLLNCHPSIANALRRALISLVPTMAIHHVFIYENSTVFPDEYIAHRIGLIPLDVDPEYFTFLNDEETYDNILNFRLHKINDTDQIINLTSDDIVFEPAENQEHMAIKLKPGILICKLAPRNEIEMTFKAIKGIGEEHAKWSPVSLCSYRIMPKIVLEKDFYGADAEELKECFSPGVIEILNGKAIVANPRLETMSREVFRHEKFKNCVKLLRESGWFCFTIESISLDPFHLLKMGLNALVQAGRNLKAEVKAVAENCRDE